MSGVLVLATPWSREYFPRDMRPEVEALIPDGYWVRVGARRRPREWTLVLYQDPTPEEKAARKGSTELARAEVHGADLPAIVRWFIKRYVPALTVTVDLEGTPTLHGWQP